MNKLNTRIPVFLLLTVLILSSCATGKKALKRGDYYGATLQAVQRLRSNPDSKNALETVSVGYPYAIDFYQNKIDAAMLMNDPLKYSKIVDYYGRLNHLADEIDRCPAAKNIIPAPKRYYSEIAEAKQRGAEERYELGQKALAIGTREAAREAYFHFLECNKFQPGFKDVNNMIFTAKYEATLKVLLEQIPVAGYVNEISSEFFYNQIIEHLRNSYATEFVRFMSVQELEAEEAEPDQYLRMKFDEFVMGQVYDKELVEEVSKDSVIVGKVTLGDTTVNAYNTVKAKLTTFTRELHSHGVLDVILVDTYNNQVLAQRKFPGEYTWITKWGNYSGDERALSGEQIAITKQKPVPPPPPQQLFIEFTRPMFNQVTPFLATYFKKQ